MTIATADIEQGDLLLFHGNSFISWAIRKIDGSEVNHVAIALPDGQLAEAGGLGLQTRPIPMAFSDTDYMLVRRHLAADPRKPVVSTAQKYLDNGNLYAYQQIVLLAVLGLTRRIPARGLARRMLRSALDHAARALMDLLPVGKSWMICSEYVYRCFDESATTRPHPFTIGIQGVTYGGPTFGAESWLDWAESDSAAVDLTPGIPSFSDAPGQDADKAAEEELAPLIAEWARFAGVDDADPLPGLAAASFGPADLADAEADQRAEVSDDDMRDAMVRFATTFEAAWAMPAGIPADFGVLPGGVAAAAAEGALSGLRKISIDPNFVTPRDLLVSNSFGDPERAV